MLEFVYMNNTRNGFNIILGIIALLVVGGAVCIYENTNHGNKEAPTTAADRSPLQHDFDLKIRLITRSASL